MRKLLGKLAKKAIVRTGRILTGTKVNKKGRFYRGGGKKNIRNVKASTVKRAGKIGLGVGGAAGATAGSVATGSAISNKIKSNRKKNAAAQAAATKPKKTKPKAVIGVAKPKVSITAPAAAKKSPVKKAAKKAVKKAAKKVAKKKLTPFQKNRLRGDRRYR